MTAEVFLILHGTPALVTGYSILVLIILWPRCSQINGVARNSSTFFCPDELLPLHCTPVIKLIIFHKVSRMG